MKKIDLTKVTLGSDAEVFLKDATGRFFPVCGLVGGTKQQPKYLTDDGVAVQEDNVMLEFNTPVSVDHRSWVSNIQRAYQLAVAQLPPGFVPVVEATANFDPAFLQSKQAQTFGCEPDFNGWDMSQNPRPIPEDPTLRSAAAHVHIGWPEPEDIEQRCRVIQWCDVFVSLPSVWESQDRKRRQLYGKAGSFRPKEYGVEHRVLDNYWLTGDVENIWWRYMSALEATNSDLQIPPEDALAIQTAINTYDHRAADALHAKYSELLHPAHKYDWNTITYATR